MLILPALFSLYPQATGSATNIGILIFFTMLYGTDLASAILIYQKKYYGIIAALIFHGLQSLYIQTSTLTYFSTGLFSLLWILPLGFDLTIGSNFIMNFTDSWAKHGGLCSFSLLLSAKDAFRETDSFSKPFVLNTKTI